MTLTIETIKARALTYGYEMVKYVRMASGRFRFCEASADHTTMLADGESRGNVDSAGTLVIRGGALYWEGQGSVTLNIPGGDCLRDEARLEKLLGLLFAGPY